MGLIKRLWRGEVRLWKAFWFGYILVGGASVWLVTLLLSALADLNTFQILSSIVMIAYTLFFAIVLWRSAWNANHAAWGYITRGVVVLAVIMIPVMLTVQFIGNRAVEEFRAGAAFNTAVEALNSHPNLLAVREALGAPIEAGEFLALKAVLYGDAKFEAVFAISGPDGDGQAELYAEKNETGDWVLRSINAAPGQPFEGAYYNVSLYHKTYDE